jgi:phage shock protein A
MVKPMPDGPARRTAKKRWYQFWATQEMKADDALDPEVALHQATIEAGKRQAAVSQGAAGIIGIRNELQMQYDDTVDRLQKLENKARAALQRKQDFAASDPEKAQQFHDAALTLASEIQPLREEVDRLAGQLANADAQAQAAKQSHRTAERQRLETDAKAQQLRGMVQSTKMQDAINASTAALERTAGDGAPSLGDVERKIRARYAASAGMAELQSESVGAKMREVDEALAVASGEDFLAQLEAELLGPPAALPAGNADGDIIDAEVLEDAPATAPASAPAAAPAQGTPGLKQFKR